MLELYKMTGDENVGMFTTLYFEMLIKKYQVEPQLLEKFSINLTVRQKCDIYIQYIYCIYIYVYLK